MYNLTLFWLSSSSAMEDSRTCLVVKFDQILALAPVEPWSSCAVVLGLSSII